MAKPPWWMKLEPTGTTEKGNYGVRLRVSRWVVPWLWLWASVDLLLYGPQEHATSCDGLEVTGVVFK